MLHKNHNSPIQNRTCRPHSGSSTCRNTLTLVLITNGPHEDTINRIQKRSNKNRYFLNPSAPKLPRFFEQALIRNNCNSHSDLTWWGEVGGIFALNSRIVCLYAFEKVVSCQIQYIGLTEVQQRPNIGKGLVKWT